MAYGKIKVDNLVYDNGGSDVEIAVSGIPSSSSLAAKANVASPTFTGTPAAPTAAVSTNTTQVATTAFVVAEIADEVGTTVQAFDADTAKTDAVQTYTAAQRGEITTLTSGATVTPNLNDSNNFTLTLGQNLTIANPTNCTAGQSGSIFLVQDGTGSRTAAWGSYCLLYTSPSPRD